MIGKIRPTLCLSEIQREVNPRRKSVRAYRVDRHYKSLSLGASGALPESRPELQTDISNFSDRRRRLSVSEMVCSSELPQNKTQTGVRISKLMAERGLCSRREADVYIERGWVYVDGQQVTKLGSRAQPSAKISLNKAAQTVQRRQVTILLNKPLGYVSGQPEPGCIPAVSLIRPENQYSPSFGDALFSFAHLKGLAPAGRLDVNSTGLLVLTQDGRVARQLVGETSDIEKEYLVRIEGTLDDMKLALLKHGLSLDGKPLKPAKVEPINADQLRFILNEGRKRQIRRMCELVGLRVVGLKRVRIGSVRLGRLPLGKWRYLSKDESF